MTITKVVPAFSYSASKTVLVRSYFRRPSTGTLAWPSAPSASSPGSSSSLTRSSSWPPTSPRRSRSRSSNSLPSAAPFKQLLLSNSCSSCPAVSLPQLLLYLSGCIFPTASLPQLLHFPNCFTSPDDSLFFYYLLITAYHLIASLHSCPTLQLLRSQLRLPSLQLPSCSLSCETYLSVKTEAIYITIYSPSDLPQKLAVS